MTLTLSKRSRICILLLYLSGIIAAQLHEQVRITGTFSGPAIQVLKQIEQQYPVRFFYKEEWFASEVLNVNFRSNSVIEAAEKIVSGKPYTYRIINDNKVVFLPREEVAALVGQITNYSSRRESEKEFVLIKVHLGDSV